MKNNDENRSRKAFIEVEKNDFKYAQQIRRFEWCKKQRILKAGYTLFVSDISRMFSQNTTKCETLRNAKHSLYTFRISGEFGVLLMPQKNKQRNPLSFCANADPGAKCCEMQKAKKEVRNAKKVVRNTLLYTFCFSPFTPIFALSL